MKITVGFQCSSRKGFPKLAVIVTKIGEKRDAGKYLENNYDNYCKPFFAANSSRLGRRGGLMVSALVSGSSGPGSSPGRGRCVVFLGKTLYSHSASLHPGV